MRRVTSLFSTSLVIAGLVACGSGGGAVSSAADRWVDDVCGRMMALDHELAAETSEFQHKLDAQSDPESILASLDSYVSGTSAFVRLAAKDISRLGTPAITERAAVVSDIDDVFYAYKTESSKIGSSVKQAIGTGVTTAEDALMLVAEIGRLGDIGEEMRAVLADYDELQDEFDDSATCQQWAEPATVPSTTPTTSVTTTTTTTTTPPTTVPPTTIAPTTLPATTIPETTAPPTTVDPYAVARDMYAAAADEYNPQFDAMWDYYFDEDGFILYVDAPTYCAQYALLMRQWNERMSAIPWPADVQDEADIHITEGSILIGMLDQCAAAPATRAGVDALLTDIEAEEETYFVTIDPLRAAVGLPPRYGE
jgi:hypothetical protein